MFHKNVHFISNEAIQSVASTNLEENNMVLSRDGATSSFDLAKMVPSNHGAAAPTLHAK